MGQNPSGVKKPTGGKETRGKLREEKKKRVSVSFRQGNKKIGAPFSVKQKKKKGGA